MREQLQEQILDGIVKLAHANNAHEQAAKEHGLAEHAYRQSRAVELVRVCGLNDENGKKLTEAHRAALVDIATDKAMYRVRLAEAEHEAAWELVKSLKTQISALQSLLGAVRAEAEAVTYRQTAGA
jgi:hypothetical protein